MKTIVGGRQSGKTTEMIKTAYDTNAAIICSTRNEAQYIRKTAKEMNLHEDRLNIFTIQDVVSGQMNGTNFSGIVIDNGDLVLQRLLVEFTAALDKVDFIVQYVTPSRIMPSRITDGSDYD